MSSDDRKGSGSYIEYALIEIEQATESLSVNQADVAFHTSIAQIYALLAIADAIGEMESGRP